MKSKKKDDQSVDASLLLKGENKIFTGGDMETKFGEEPLSRPYLYCHQTQTILLMPRSDISVY